MVAPLPLLLNPLLHHLFNNPRRSLRLKTLHENIATSPSRYTILVPSTQLLLTANDLLGHPLRDACSSDDFVAAHVLQPALDPRNGLCIAANKAQVRVGTEAVVVAGTLPVRHRTFRILATDVFANFAGYLPSTAAISLIYIDRPVVNYPPPPPEDPALAPTASTAPAEDGIAILTQTLEAHPAAAAEFAALVLRLNLRKTPMRQIRPVFDQACVGALRAVLPLLPLLILTLSLHAYVELHLYDVVWHRFVKLTTADELRLQHVYGELRHLSLNQVGLPALLSKADLAVLRARVAKAVSTFHRMALALSCLQRQQALLDTFAIVSDPSGPVVDADTLVGLLVLVVVLARVDNLPAHIAYLTHMHPHRADTTTGQLGYAVLTLEAVLYHLSSDENVELLHQALVANSQLWEAIAGGPETLQTFLATHPLSSTPDLPLFSHNLAGELVLMQAIRHDNLQVLLDTGAFSLNDLVHDCNNSRTTLLSAALQWERPVACDTLAGVVMTQCSEQEQRHYINSPDMHGRAASHHLFLDRWLLSQLAPLADWELGDALGHTPLTAACRAYDHPDYPQMVRAVFAAAAPVRSARHTDLRGNTLLHILPNNLQLVLGLACDTNALNNRHLTPLMVSARYHRMDNVRQLMADPRTIVDKSTADGVSVWDTLLRFPEVRSEMETLVLAHSRTPVVATTVKASNVRTTWNLRVCGSLAGETMALLVALLLVEQLWLLLALGHPFAATVPPMSARPEAAIPRVERRMSRRMLVELNAALAYVFSHPTLGGDSLVWEWLVVPGFGTPAMEPSLRQRTAAQRQSFLELFPSTISSGEVNDCEVWVGQCTVAAVQTAAALDRFQRLAVFATHKRRDLHTTEQWLQAAAPAELATRTTFYERPIDDALAVTTPILAAAAATLVRHFESAPSAVDEWWNVLDRKNNNSRQLERLEQQGVVLEETTRLHRLPSVLLQPTSEWEVEQHLLRMQPKRLLFGGAIELKQDRYRRLLVTRLEIGTHMAAVSRRVAWSRQQLEQLRQDTVQATRATLRHALAATAAAALRDARALLEAATGVRQAK